MTKLTLYTYSIITGPYNIKYMAKNWCFLFAVLCKDLKLRKK